MWSMPPPGVARLAMSARVEGVISIMVLGADDNHRIVLHYAAEREVVRHCVEFRASREVEPGIPVGYPVPSHEPDRVVGADISTATR